MSQGSEGETSARRTEHLKARVAELEGQLAREHGVEQKLQDSEQRFRVIAETVPMPIVITRASDGLILFANRRMGETFGVPAEQMEGRISREFYDDPAERGRVMRVLERDGEIREYEMLMRRADGQRLWISTSAHPITYCGEDAILISFADITPHKQTEASLHAERRQLQRLIDLHERDRRLIAFEIHDGMVQQLAAAAMHLESAAFDAELAGAPAHESVATAIRLIRRSIDEARRLIHGLSPPVLDDGGIVPALESLVAEAQLTGELTVELEQETGIGRLAPALETAVYRIVQESLQNVRRHSRSPRAAVRVANRDGRLEVCVRDWGRGFDLEGARRQGSGLRGIRERVRLMGGELHIDSKPDQGTEVRVVLTAVQPEGDAGTPSAGD